MTPLAPMLAALLLLAAMPVRAAVFGVIVIDDNLNGARGNGAYAVGQAGTVKEARRVAMSNCTLGGNVACTIKLTYPRCGAYVASAERGEAAAGDTLQAAIEAAREACGLKSCKLIVADCVDLPLRPPPPE